MGIMNHDCVIATTWCNVSMTELAIRAEEAGIKRLTVTEPNEFGYQTAVLPPDGSKEGWAGSDCGDQHRETLIELIKTFDYGDGSSPFSWIEVSFGEYGQKITTGNNRNQY